MRDLKQVRKEIRRRHKAEPWILAVRSAGPGEPEIGPRLGLDVLAYERARAPGPLLLCFGPITGAGLDPALAYLALSEDVSADRPAPLAIDGRMIDISQPREPVPLGSIASLAQTLLQRMRAEGLLT